MIADVGRVLVVPAAGRGTRLESPLPKFMTPVAGRAMIDHVLDRHASHVSDAIIVTRPEDRATAEAHLRPHALPLHFVTQPSATGMLDALLLTGPALAHLSASRVWISWCDQVAISAATVRRLADAERTWPAAAAIFPIVLTAQPYVHFEFNGPRPTRVQHRREDDEMPVTGTADAGLFSLSRAAFLRDLPEYATTASLGPRTGERNFLPFLPWIAARAEVHTFEIDPAEAAGVNTPDDVRAAELRLLSDRP